MRPVVVLGGGGAKTAAHLGVARALREAGIAPVQWIGTSMGSVMAAALASGREPQAILEQVVAIRREDVLRTDWRAVPRGIWARALMKSAPIRALIERLIPERAFDHLATPCSVTAVEVDTGREIVFGAAGEQALLVDALAAACALPPYFAPVNVNGRAFYDGGLRAAVPIECAAMIDCSCVIAVDTGPGFDVHGENVETPPALVAATDIAMGWLMAGTTQLLRDRWDAIPGRPPLIWLRPVTDRGAMFAAERTGRYAEAGYRAMAAVLEELQ